MAKEALILEVGASGFDRYVIENSHHVPVLVLFMAVWSGPCMAMAHELQELASEFPGQFIFAKVDAQEQQELAERYEVMNVPTLMVFHKGEMSFSQEGQFQADELRVMLKGLGIFHHSDELRLQARDKHLAGESGEAIMLMSQAIKLDPRNTRVAMDMVQIFLDIGELEQAKRLYNKLPERDRESEMGKTLLGQLTFADLAANTPGLATLHQRLAQNPHDHDARFELAICLVAAHDLNGAVEQLFTLLKTEPHYKEGAAREMIITIVNMLAPNDAEQAAKYRTRLANNLSS